MDRTTQDDRAQVRSGETESKGRSTGEIEVVCEEDPRPWIPPGLYEAICLDVRRYDDLRFKREAIVLEFAIMRGISSDICLQRFYPGRKLDKGRPLCDRLAIGRNSALYRELTIARQGVPLARTDRTSLRVFLHKRFLVRVSTVSKTWRDVQYPQGMCYSKVGEVISLVKEES